ncbi:DUF2922 domain-containing protein [Lysinibacillus sp. fls2-241-R2A-57]|uniref:DUF2922 domain-containing protein n=1 Tax=Lysinibacillus sp. fls2-241-R2A-57 TaxID=3040292 RepID=UPI0025563281|nr:DUF2922 domain-containing protein [Lysinibacillus sp. fls2-241-R2A-57]
MTQVLELQFETAAGKTATIVIDAPKPTVTAEEIQKVMQTIITKNVFGGQAGALVAMSGARIVDRQVTEFELEVE